MCDSLYAMLMRSVVIYGAEAKTRIIDDILFAPLIKVFFNEAAIPRPERCNVCAVRSTDLLGVFGPRLVQKVTVGRQS